MKRPTMPRPKGFTTVTKYNKEICRELREVEKRCGASVSYRFRDGHKFFYLESWETFTGMNKGRMTVMTISVTPTSPIHDLLDGLDKVYYFVDNVGSRLIAYPYEAYQSIKQSLERQSG